MNISEKAIRKPVTTIMAMVALMFVGLISYFRLGVELFPDVSFPIVVVHGTYVGASSQEIETLVSKPIEEAVGAINGVKHIRSTSGGGASVTIIEFELDKDIQVAASDVREKVDLIRSNLPDDLNSLIITKVDPDAAPIMTYALGGDYPVERLSDLMEDVIKPRLEQLDGVAAVNISGAMAREVQVALDPVLLRRYGVSPVQVATKLRSENFNLPSGRVSTADSEINLRTTNAFETAAAIRALPITVTGGRQVTLGDLGTVEDGFKEQRSRSWVNGKAALAFAIQRQSGANTIDVAEAVHAEVDKLRKALPPGVSIDLSYDMTKFIVQSKDASLEELLIGAALAIVVIFAFVRVVRGTIIAALAIPTSIIGTYAMMYMLGFSLNMMTLMALTLVVGVLVDDAVVDLENIFRFMEEGEQPFEAAIKATDEIGLAVVATTFSIVAVFLPIGFMGGMVGKFFSQFGLTVSCSVLISLVVARTLTPTLAAYWLKPMPIKTEHVDPWYTKLYRPVLAWSLTHRKSVVAIAVGFFVVSFPIMALIPKGFVPKNDRDEFRIAVKMPPGTAIEKTSDVVQEIAARANRHPMVKTTLAIAGASSGHTVDTGNISVTCMTKAEGRKQTTSSIQEEIRATLAGIAGAKITFDEIRAVDNGQGAYPISLRLQGNDLTELAHWSDKITAELKKLPGVIDTDTSSAAAQQEFQVQIDHEQAAELGISVGTLASTLRMASQGDESSKLRLPDRDVDIRVRLTDETRYDLATLENLTLMAANGSQVPLGSVAKLSLTMGPTVIERFDRMRQVSIKAATVPGVSTGNIVYPMEETIKQMGLPATMRHAFEGEAEMMQDSFNNLLMALLMAVVFIYLILASQFEHFLHPFTIMMSVPLSFSGAFFGLFIANEELSMMSMIGIVMLMGLVVKNAILLVDYTITLRQQGVERNEALLRAGPVRLRPILMTTIAMIAGMIPVAMRLTIGSEGRAPMAVAVIGGLITSTLLTLVVVPVTYTLVDDAVNTVRRWLGKAPAEPKAGGPGEAGEPALS